MYVPPCLTGNTNLPLSPSIYPFLLFFFFKNVWLYFSLISILCRHTHTQSSRNNLLSLHSVIHMSVQDSSPLGYCSLETRTPPTNSNIFYFSLHITILLVRREILFISVWLTFFLNLRFLDISLNKQISIIPRLIPGCKLNIRRSCQKWR